ncbi:hypothetical protein H0H92_008981 [Tricholoma furcatifolium]|nr:hypothetical protein H0H92_008981 [Tricholoma furcatifolium]
MPPKEGIDENNIVDTSQTRKRPSNVFNDDNVAEPVLKQRRLDLQQTTGKARQAAGAAVVDDILNDDDIQPRIEFLLCQLLRARLPANHRLPLPLGFPGDIMHVLNLNFGDLLPPLWRGMFTCADTDNVRHWPWFVLPPLVWQAHGMAVQVTRQFLPGSFDRPPRNITQKISSGYKAKEWQGYLYGLAPALLHGILPPAYHQNFCKLVAAVRILHQHRITLQQLQHAQTLVEEFHLDFELLYCQRCADQIHFVRPCIHAVVHLPKETAQLGPAPLYSTWTMERMIGDLGREIRQASDPYQNLSERGLQRCQTNALFDTFPQLVRKQNDTLHPRGSLDIGDGYVLLRAKEEYGKILTGIHGASIAAYMIQREAKLGNSPPPQWPGPKVAKWARLRLPNGQILRSAWKENDQHQENVR